MTVLEQIQQGTCGKYAAEVIFFLFKIRESMLDPSMRLYIYHSVCLQEFPGASQFCINPKNENHIQDLNAFYIMMYKILLNSPVIIFGLFCGAWNDHIGRKIPVVMACTGSIFAVLLSMVSMVVDFRALALVLAGAALRGIFGKSAVVTMALHTYIADISSKEDWTEHLGMLFGMNFLGYFVGSLLTGLLLQLTSFNLIFCTVILIYSFCVVIALMCMRESLPGMDAIHPPKIHNLFNIKHVRDSLGVIFRACLEHDRMYIWFFFICIISQNLTKSGEVDITLLFTKRAPLNWSKSLSGYLFAAQYACLRFSVLILLPLLVLAFRPHDLCLVAIGTAFKGLKVLIMAFADQTWLVFLSVFIGCPGGMVVMNLKSLLSKIVAENEIGKLFSILSCLESVSNLIGTVIFTNIYTATVARFFPGFTYVMDSAFYGLIVLSIIAAWQDMKRQPKFYLIEDSKPPKGYCSTKDETMTDLTPGDDMVIDGCETSKDVLAIDRSSAISSTNSAEYEIFKSDTELMPLTEDHASSSEEQSKETRIGN